VLTQVREIGSTTNSHITGPKSTANQTERFARHWSTGLVGGSPARIGEGGLGDATRATSRQSHRDRFGFPGDSAVDDCKCDEATPAVLTSGRRPRSPSPWLAAQLGCPTLVGAHRTRGRSPPCLRAGVRRRGASGSAPLRRTGCATTAPIPATTDTGKTAIVVSARTPSTSFVDKRGGGERDLLAHHHGSRSPKPGMSGHVKPHPGRSRRPEGRAPRWRRET
jgi:hypothetical protein